MISERLQPRRTRQFDCHTTSESEEEHPDLVDSSEDEKADSEDEKEQEEVSKATDEEALSMQDDDLESVDSSKKRKKPNMTRDFVLRKSWNLELLDAADVHAAIWIELGELNATTGLGTCKPVQHLDRNNIYGDWQFRRHWVSSKGNVSNKIFSCPMVHRADCKCQAKVVETSRDIKLYIADMHTAEDHRISKDKAKFLTFEQRKVIADTVRIAPLQTAGELMRNRPLFLVDIMSHPCRI